MAIFNTDNLCIMNDMDYLSQELKVPSSKNILNKGWKW